MIWLSALGSARIGAAVVVILLLLALCLGTWLRERRARRAARASAAALLPTGDAAAPLLIAHASQTGTAEEFAWQTARSLQLAGIPVRVTSLAGLALDTLRRIERALFIVSTYGEGDPPDAAAPFVRGTMLASAAGAELGNMHFGVLALGDSTYAQFCGFGRTLDRWLRDHGAKALFDRIDVDRAAGSALERWRQELAHLGGTRDAPDWSAPAFDRWVLADRVHLNPRSAGEAVSQLSLVPAAAAPLPEWEAGDLLQIRVPGETQPREYSIASIPADGAVQLLVRQARRADGSLGSASGWLLGQVRPGDTIEARLRAHPGFRLGDNARRPLILIGNGTGLAGLRALIKARAAQRGSMDGAAARCWLLFGERSARHDGFYADELRGWREEGVLTRCDLVFSRDQPQRRYVQHRLAECREELRRWIEAGAAIYVCGSLAGMAAEVDAELAAALGRARLDALTVEGRYRRDVY